MLKRFLKKIVNHLGFEIRRKNLLETHYQIDPLFNNLYNQAQQKTQMTSTDNALRRQRHYVLNYLLINVDFSSGGDICETGCWRGLSAYQIASYIKKMDIDVTFHIFDSFQGLSDFQSEDFYAGEKRSLENIKKQFECSVDEVKENLREFEFIEYYKGWIPDRFAEVADKTFSLVHIDVDLYQPIYDSIDYFYPRLVPKGIMVFDDYGCIQFPGAKKAVDDFLKKIGRTFFLPLPSGQAFLIKN
jgi:hypothetical protein